MKIPLLIIALVILVLSLGTPRRSLIYTNRIETQYSVKSSLFFGLHLSLYPRLKPPKCNLYNKTISTILRE